MKPDRLPPARSRGVLSGHSTLGLPTFPGPAYQPSPLVPQPALYAAPVRIKAPRGWKTTRIGLVDLVLPIDASGSMYGPGGDPRGVRRAAALSVVALMAKARGARVGVVHWGTVAPAELTLPLTDVRDRRRIEAGLALPPSLGGNNFPAALARCREVLEASDPARIQLVVCITDGIEAVGSDPVEQLALLPARSVHVLLVDHSHGCTPDLEAGWAALALGSFTRLDLLDTTQMAYQAAGIVTAAAGTALPPPTTTHRTTRRTPS